MMKPEVGYEWQSLGRIFVPLGDNQRLLSHATRPIPIHIPEKGLIRVFFSSRNSDDIPQATYIDVSDSDPTRVLFVCEKPLLELGSPGTFDDSGITPTQIFSIGGSYYMYYVGWKRRRTGDVTIEPSIGLALIDRDLEVVKKFSSGPILCQNVNDPFFTAAPFMVNDKQLYRFFYCSGQPWVVVAGKPEMFYSIKTSVSPSFFDLKSSEEYIFNENQRRDIDSAPWVRKKTNEWEMWFSSRGIQDPSQKQFSIQYALSKDGAQWFRNASLGGLIPISGDWDSQGQCYPAPLTIFNKTYLFFSGNDSGKSGMGVALAKIDRGYR